MRKLSSLLLLMVLSICWSYAQQAKYVFYFIGDGMGVNQVQGTEIYRAELEGKIGIAPLLLLSSPILPLQLPILPQTGLQTRLPQVQHLPPVVRPKTALLVYWRIRKPQLTV